MKTWLLAVLCIAVSSCSLFEETDAIPEQNKPKTTRLSTTSYYFTDQSSNQIKFIYNDTGKLIRKDWYNSNNEVEFYEDYIYQQGRLTKIKRSISKGEFAEVRFFYTNSQIHTIEYWMEDANARHSKLHSIDFEYSGEQITKSTTFFTNGSPSYYSIYNFTNGNLMSVKTYILATNELLEEDFYAYDNKINPFYALTHQYLGNPVNSSKNNVVHYKIVSYKHIPQDPELSFEYSYTDNGFPLKKYILGKAGKKYLDESFTYELSN